MPYNLASPNGLIDPVDPANVARWLDLECLQIESEAIRHVVLHVAGNLKEFLHWPEHAVLLWQGCNRVKPEGKKQKYHAYPIEIRQRAMDTQFRDADESHGSWHGRYGSGTSIVVGCGDVGAAAGDEPVDGVQ